MFQSNFRDSVSVSLIFAAAPQQRLQSCSSESRNSLTFAFNICSLML